MRPDERRKRVGHRSTEPDRTYRVFGKAQARLAMSMAPHRVVGCASPPLGRAFLCLSVCLSRPGHMCWLPPVRVPAAGRCRSAQGGRPESSAARTVSNPAGPLDSRVRWWWQLLYDSPVPLPPRRGWLQGCGEADQRCARTKVSGSCATSVALEEHVGEPREVRRNESHRHRERHKQAVVLVLTEPIEKPVASWRHEV